LSRAFSSEIDTSMLPDVKARWSEIVLEVKVRPRTAAAALARILTLTLVCGLMQIKLLLCHRRGPPHGAFGTSLVAS